MKFMLLVHHDEQAFDKLDKSTQEQLLAESVALTHQLHAKGQYLSASPLQPASTAVIIRVREGKPIVTDGPFIETREQIAGYFLIDAKNIDEAISIATRVPGARIGPIEIRPLREITGLPGEQGEGITMQKITPFLWFDNHAEAAVNHYLSIFKNSKIETILRCGDAGPGPKGSVLTIAFQLEGLKFIALNGGPVFKFNEAISLSVDCKSQQEVDDLWEKLSAGGQKSQCGWLKDKFGLSWQIVPSVLVEMLQDKDAEKTKRVMAAMMQMGKLDIAVLQQAYAQ